MKRIIYIALIFTIIVSTSCSKGTKQLTVDPKTYQQISEKYAGVDHAKELNKYLTEIKSMVEAHNWPTFFSKCSPDHYMQQVGSGNTTAVQYIAEAMGLHSQNNDIAKGGAVTYDQLNTIKTLNYETVTFDGNNIHITGKVKTNQSDYNLNMLVTVKDGKYYLTGAAG